MSKAAELASLIGNINAGGGGVNRNAIINGAMNVARRATSSTGLGADTSSTTTTRYKVCDRWGFEASGTNGRFTMSQDTSVPTGKGFANSLKLDCTTADTSVAAGELLVLQQRIEGQNLQAFAKGTSEAKPFALSFYAKANASKTYVAELFDIDNSRHCNIAFTVGTDWTKHEITFPADTTGAFDDNNGGSVRFNIWLHAGTTFNPTSGGALATTWQAEDADDRATGIDSFFSSTDNTFFITGVQLEVGQNPTEFEHEPYETSLRKCERYFHIVHQDYDGGGTGSDDTSLSNYTALGIGSHFTGARPIANYYFPQPMRAIPTLAVNFGSSGNQGFIGYTNNTTDYIGTTATLHFPSVYGCMVEMADGSGTGGHAMQMVTQYDDQSFSFIAEL